MTPRPDDRVTWEKGRPMPMMHMDPEDREFVALLRRIQQTDPRLYAAIFTVLKSLNDVPPESAAELITRVQRALERAH